MTKCFVMRSYVASAMSGTLHIAHMTKKKALRGTLDIIFIMSKLLVIDFAIRCSNYTLKLDSLHKSNDGKAYDLW